MMKKITLLLAFLTVSFAFSQATHTIDFEPAGVGSSWSWTANSVAPDFNVITNPVSGGINTSSTVVEFIAYTTDNNWALCFTDDNGEFTFDATNSTVKIMVYKPTISNVAIKFEGASPDIEINVPNTLINQWEELTFDFSGQIGNTFNRLVVIPDFVTPYVDGTDRTTNNTLYFDNLQVPEGSSPAETCSDGIMNQDETGIDCGGSICAPCAAPPTVAAPTPPARDPADVKSIFSDSYTPITTFTYATNGNVDTYNTDWCGANTEEVIIAGNSTNKITGLGCEGIDFQSARFDATSFTHLHIDIFIEAATMDKSFNMKFSNWNGGTAEDSAIEFSLTNGSNPVLPNPNPGTWVSLDIPLSDFTVANKNDNRNDLVQFIISSDLGTVYYDNLYLYKVVIPPGTCSDGIQNQDETGIDCGGTICAPCTGPPTVAAPTPPARNAADVLSIYSDAYTDITIDNFDFGLCDGGVPNLAVSEVMIAGNPTQNYLKPGCQGISMETNRIDASTFTNLHFDFFTDVSGVDLIGKVFNIKLVDWAGNPTEAGATGLEVNFNDGTNPAIITSSWVSVDVDITAIGGMVAGNLTRSDIAQIHITSNLPNAWYDNLYLYKGSVLGTADVEFTELKVYPNPSSNVWNFVSAQETISDISIYNVLGKQVKSIQPKSLQATIDISDLSSGIYFARLASSSHDAKSTVKLIKQ